MVWKAHLHRLNGIILNYSLTLRRNGEAMEGLEYWVVGCLAPYRIFRTLPDIGGTGVFDMLAGDLLSRMR